MTFLRLRVADWVAMAAALALLFSMAADWYTSAAGENARLVERQAKSGAAISDYERELREDARLRAEGQENNAWQAEGALDRVILVVLVGAAALAVGAGFLRAAGRRFEPPLTPSGLTAIAAALGGLLVAYRLVQQPGDDGVTVIQAGAPLGLAALGLLALASAVAVRNEQAGRSFRELRPETAPGGEGEAAPGQEAPGSREATPSPGGPGPEAGTQAP